jgi:glutamate carboxypeptidase
MTEANGNLEPFEAQKLLEEIRAWVEIESPTTDAAAVNRAVARSNRQDLRVITVT